VECCCSLITLVDQHSLEHWAAAIIARFCVQRSETAAGRYTSRIGNLRRNKGAGGGMVCLPGPLSPVYCAGRAVVGSGGGVLRRPASVGRMEDWGSLAGDFWRVPEGFATGSQSSSPHWRASRGSWQPCWLLALVAVFAIPVGVGRAGFSLRKMCRQGALDVIQTNIDNLAGCRRSVTVFSDSQCPFPCVRP